jgi:beta-glucosidase
MLSTLVMEVDRDPRMGRNEEAYTEDPYLYMRIGETIVRATQGSDISAPDKVIAVLTDFPTQSEPASGLERGRLRCQTAPCARTSCRPGLAPSPKPEAWG